MGLLSKLLGRESAPALPPPTYSNAAVLTRIQKEHGVDPATAHGWFGEMLIFLDLCARSDEMLSPPPDVDKAWHAFLLHSRDYEAYCTERFGRVIHHQPTGEPDPAAYRRAYERRQDYGTTATTTTDSTLWAVPVVASSTDSSPQAGEPAPDAPTNPDGFGGEASGDSIGSTDSSSSDSGSSSSDSGGSSCSSGSSCGGGGS